MDQLKDKTLISIRLADGRSTGEVPMTVFKEALAVVTNKSEPSKKDAHGIARDQLRAFVERIQRLNEDLKTINDDKKDVYGEAKSMGFDTKVLKRVVHALAQDPQVRMEEDLVFDTYMAALGHGEDPSED